MVVFRWIGFGGEMHHMTYDFRSFRQDIRGKVVHLDFGFRNYSIDTLNTIIG